MTVYHPFEQEIGGGRLFVHAARRSLRAGAADHAHHPRASADQPVERAATLDDVRAEVLAPESAERAGLRRLRGGGADHRGGRRRRRAGVLGERAHARVRHPPRDRLDAAPPADAHPGRGRGDRRHRHRRRRDRRRRAGAGGSGAIVTDVDIPGALPVVAAAAVLVAAAVVASLMPAARASRVDVSETLRDA